MQREKTSKCFTVRRHTLVFLSQNQKKEKAPRFQCRTLDVFHSRVFLYLWSLFLCGCHCSQCVYITFIYFFVLSSVSLLSLRLILNCPKFPREWQKVIVMTICTGCSSNLGLRRSEGRVVIIGRVIRAQLTFSYFSLGETRPIIPTTAAPRKEHLLIQPRQFASLSSRRESWHSGCYFNFIFFE